MQEKLEKEIQKDAIKHLFEIGVYAWRNNTGATPSEYKGKRRMIQFGLTGSSDIIAIYQGYFVGIEMKRPGGKQNENQKAFQQNVEDAGGFYFVATCNNDIDKNLKLIKKKIYGR